MTIDANCFSYFLSQFLLQLHLKYVNAVVKLRPSMQHLKPLKKMNTSHAEVDMIDSEDIKEEKDIKQVLYLLKTHFLSLT